MKTIFCLLIILLPLLVNGQYTGTGSVTQGGGMTTDSNLYSCSGGRITNVGTITASDNSVWTVPADVNFMNASFPIAYDLYNSCNGATHATSADAIAALNGSDIITIDSSGELITAFIFADNYFEMFINGVPVGKDNVPYTQFNSNIIRFKVNRPFTVAMLLVDWEEHLGVGCENNNGFEYHMGDGGMVAVFEDANNNIIETTRSNWKAQTFYTSPIIDLGCPTENGLLRLSNNCGTQDSNNGTSYYGLHWSIPSNWMNSSFDDSSWPSATTYTNDVVGVNNKPAYTNFTNIFDDPTNDAQFIWSTNLILDNEVIVRCTVGISNSIFQDKINLQLAYPFPNPFNEKINLLNKGGKEFYELYNEIGENIFSGIQIEQQDFSNLVDGVYFLKVITPNTMQTFKLIK